MMSVGRDRPYFLWGILKWHATLGWPADSCCQTLTLTHWNKTVYDNDNPNNRIIVVSLLQSRCPVWVSWCEEWWMMRLIDSDSCCHLQADNNEINQTIWSGIRPTQVFWIALKLKLASPLLHVISPLLISEDRKTDERMDKQKNSHFWWVIIISRKKNFNLQMMFSQQTYDVTISVI